MLWNIHCAGNLLNGIKIQVAQFSDLTFLFTYRNITYLLLVVTTYNTFIIYIFSSLGFRVELVYICFLLFTFDFSHLHLLIYIVLQIPNEPRFLNLQFTTQCDLRYANKNPQVGKKRKRSLLTDSIRCYRVILMSLHTTL